MSKTTRSKWNRMALPVSLIIILVAAPAIAGETEGFNRGQDLVGVTGAGNPSLSLGTTNGINRVFRFDENDDGFPELVLMIRRGIVRNRSRQTQQFENLGTLIEDQIGEEFFFFPAQTDLVKVYGFWPTHFGYNRTVATWENEEPEEEPEDEIPVE